MEPDYEFRREGFFNSIPYELYLCLRDREVFADDEALKQAMIDAEAWLFDGQIGPMLDRIEDILAEGGLQRRTW